MQIEIRQHGAQEGSGGKVVHGVKITHVASTHSSKDTDDKHVDKEGDRESNSGLN